MYQVHITSNGDSILICQMENSHLINTIKVIAKVIQASQEILQEQVKPDPLMEVLNPKYSLQSIKERAKQELKQCHDRIQPYVMEAALRGLDVTGILQAAYGRTTGIPTPGVNRITMLVNQAFDFDNLDDED